MMPSLKTDDGAPLSACRNDFPQADWNHSSKQPKTDLHTFDRHAKEDLGLFDALSFLLLSERRNERYWLALFLY